MSQTEESSSFVPPTVNQQALSSVFEAIARRRSLGLARLHPDPIDPKLIETALRAACWAPSHGDTEPWRFNVYSGEARGPLGDAFGEAYKIDAEQESRFKPETFEANRSKVWSAPVWISIGMVPGLDEHGELKMTIQEERLAVACAVQNLHLMFATMGIVGMWHSKSTSVHPHVAKFVGLEEPSELMGFFFCGWPKVEWPEGERQPFEEKVKWMA